MRFDGINVAILRAVIFLIDSLRLRRSGRQNGIERIYDLIRLRLYLVGPEDRHNNRRFHWSLLIEAVYR